MQETLKTTTTAQDKVTVRFQYRMRNKKLPEDFYKTFSDELKTEFNKLNKTPNFNVAAFSGLGAKGRRDAALTKLGISTLYFQPGRAYKMTREEAELYINEKYEAYWDDRGNEMMRLRNFSDQEIDNNVKTHEVAYIVEDRKEAEEKTKNIRRTISFKKITPLNLGVR
jgi:hypothetical protein